MGTNVKINIFGTDPVTSANVNRKNYFQHVFKHDGIYKYCYLFLFLKSKLWEVVHLLTKTRTIFITRHSLVFLYISRIHVFATDTAFLTFQEFENNQEYKPKHNCIFIEYHNFL